MASKVYFTDLHTRPGDSLTKKLKRLIESAGMGNIDFKDKFTAVKIHFGEPGNLAFLRANYAKAVCDFIKEKGGKPFLTDCNTLYVGKRKNALDHLEAAYENGFNPLATGVHCIIADGLKGTDEKLIPLEGTKYIKEAKIGSALAEADIIISLTHFKGHNSAGFGGALKNVGMGGGSRRGKLEMHQEGTPVVFEEKCIGCGTCERNCAQDAVKVVRGKAVIDKKLCVGCGFCMSVCPRDAISTDFSCATDILSEKIAEYAYAVLKDKPSFHIALAIDISPSCDCEGYNDVPIVPDVGMFASFDPVALDQACFDAVQKQPVNQNSKLWEKKQKYNFGDYFRELHPRSNGETALVRGEELGLGSRKYELTVIK